MVGVVIWLRYEVRLMPPLKPGHYCYLARCATDTCANDRYGPFDSSDEMFAWFKEHNIEYRPGAPYFGRAPLFFEEMSDGEADHPWATGAYYLYPALAKAFEK